MPQNTAVENNFTGGLKTEFTGLNFPENAAFDTDNCIYTLIGDVVRRMGFDFEANHTVSAALPDYQYAKVTYKWNNAGGDGSSEIVVAQVGALLFFYKSSDATAASPLSTKILASTVDLTTFLPAGSTNVPKNIECQFATGNGYLFVFHPYLEPFYCIRYSNDVILANVINIKQRDFTGIFDGLDDSLRLNTLSFEHLYNIDNQGWYNGTSWSATSSTSTYTGVGALTLTIPTGVAGVITGDSQVVTVNAYSNIIGTPVVFTQTGTVHAYTSGTGVLL